MAQNKNISKIVKSGYSGSIINPIGQRLLDFHILDNGTVFYHMIYANRQNSIPMTLTIYEFGILWEFDMVQLLNTL